ncbi:MAG: EAL domain-containing protein [Hyphomicrobiaceae bacterium]
MTVVRRGGRFRKTCINPSAHDLRWQNQRLQHLADELRERNINLNAALENMHQGVAMFDAEQRLVFSNKLYAAMYGLTPEQVKPGTTIRQILACRLKSGVYCVRDTEGFVDSWTGNFGAESSRVQELADGRTIAVLRRQAADGTRVVTHEDISERQRLAAQIGQQNRLLKEHEERLQAQNIQLEAALGNMMQGLAMFDSTLRIVVANARYAEIYGLDRRYIEPGTTLGEIVQHRAAKSIVAENTLEEELRPIRDSVEGKGACAYVRNLLDGRYISLCAQPLANGGFVTTHHDISERKNIEAKIAHLALHDVLTGLPNRLLLNERLENGLTRVGRGEKMAVHFLDLDRFKAVNDTLGHAIGDKLLVEVAARLAAIVRETDTIARLGGDEFAIVQVNIDGPSDATFVAERVIEQLSRPYHIGGNEITIGVSVGVSIAPDDAATPEQLMQNADLALYRAKSEGRGRCRYFEATMDEQVRARRSMESEMRAALPAGQFELYYQPLVSLDNGEITCMEALLRWNHPQLGLVSPATFIPLAEETGFLIPLGEWVIREACTTATSWPDNWRIAVNLSAGQFRSPRLIEAIMNALATSGLSPARLELEITEAVLLEDDDATLAKLFQLRSLGIRIAMDDFGTGYSSLSYLQKFPFDKIKIDRAFVQNLERGEDSLSIVRAIAAMARGLGMETTAEGIETGEQLDLVKAEGCTEMQGYLFSRPIPALKIRETYLSGEPGVKEEPAARVA